MLEGVFSWVPFQPLTEGALNGVKGSQIEMKVVRWEDSGVSHRFDITKLIWQNFYEKFGNLVNHECTLKICDLA